ncbi:MAG: hypothetical protein IIZ93_00660 [Acidaminococcaceae bacterium]|nr:hypothetical protein [Acidaminococcaceae bacterium]
MNEEVNVKTIKEAIDRVFLKEPVPLFERGEILSTLGAIREGDVGFVVSQEDYHTLVPVLEAKIERSILFRDGRKIETKGVVLHCDYIQKNGERYFRLCDRRWGNQGKVISLYLNDIADDMKLFEMQEGT